MRTIRELTRKEENFRLEKCPGNPFVHPRRDSVEPEPVGTIVLLPFRITGYDKDCDGSLMARLDNIDLTGDESGWSESRIGIHGQGFVVTLDELKKMSRESSGERNG